MIVRKIEDAEPELLTNALFWDDIEGEWIVGHNRLHEGVVWTTCGSVRDADALITDGVPLMIVASVSHWADLPPDQGVQ